METTFITLKPVTMLSKFFNWIRTRFAKNLKKSKEDFNENPFLIL